LEAGADVGLALIDGIVHSRALVLAPTDPQPVMVALGFSAKAMWSGRSLSRHADLTGESVLSASTNERGFLGSSG